MDEGKVNMLKHHNRNYHPKHITNYSQIEKNESWWIKCSSVLHSIRNSTTDEFIASIIKDFFGIVLLAVMAGGFSIFSNGNSPLLCQVLKLNCSSTEVVPNTSYITATVIEKVSAVPTLTPQPTQSPILVPHRHL